MNKQAMQVSVPEGVFSLPAIFKGTVAGYILTLVVFVIFALILSFVDFPETMAKSSTLITTVISVLVGGSVTGRSVRNMGWMNGGLTGLFYAVLLYIIGGLFTRNYIIDGNVIVLLGISIVSGAVGGVFGINIARKSHSRR